jgi:hypothetical protein
VSLLKEGEENRWTNTSDKTAQNSEKENGERSAGDDTDVEDRESHASSQSAQDNPKTTAGDQTEPQHFFGNIDVRDDARRINEAGTKTEKASIIHQAKQGTKAFSQQLFTYLHIQVDRSDRYCEEAESIRRR